VTRLTFVLVCVVSTAHARPARHRSHSSTNHHIHALRPLIDAPMPR